jgi:hypothetical protein
MPDTVLCSKCGQTLATYSGELGVHRQVAIEPGVRVSVEKNALGEELGWARCPKCRTRTRISATYLPGTRRK